MGTNKLLTAALLVMGSAASFPCLAHWEGVEAADPATPAALLSFESAASRYVAPDSDPLPWRERFAETPGEHDAHAGHAGANPQPPSPTRQ